MKTFSKLLTAVLFLFAFFSSALAQELPDHEVVQIESKSVHPIDTETRTREAQVEIILQDGTLMTFTSDFKTKTSLGALVINFENGLDGWIVLSHFAKDDDIYVNSGYQNVDLYFLSGIDLDGSRIERVTIKTLTIKIEGKIAIVLDDYEHNLCTVESKNRGILWDKIPARD